MQGGNTVPWTVVCYRIVDAVAMVVHVARRDGWWTVDTAARIIEYDDSSNRWQVTPVWQHRAQ